MKVEANYRGKGRYYTGKIAKENRDGTFDVDYDDGEFEGRVEPENIRSLEKGGGGGGGGGGKLEVGMKVEANYRGKGRYYTGKIAKENRDGTFDIDYDDGEFEGRMEAKDIRPLGNGSGESYGRERNFSDVGMTRSRR
jgi:hypothetical protein